MIFHLLSSPTCPTDLLANREEGLTSQGRLLQVHIFLPFSLSLMGLPWSSVYPARDSHHRLGIGRKQEEWLDGYQYWYGQKWVSYVAHEAWRMKILQMSFQDLWPVFIFFLTKTNTYIPILKSFYGGFGRYQENSSKNQLNKIII